MMPLSPSDFASALRGDDGGGHLALHVNAAQPVQQPRLVEARLPGIALPTGRGDRVEMAGEGIAALRPAMRHQGTLRDTRRVGVVHPLHLEAGEFPLDALGDGEVGDEAAAVDRHQLGGEFQDGIGEVCHAPEPRLPGGAPQGRMRAMTQSYLDPRRGRTWPLGHPRWSGDAREPLLLTPRRGIARDEILTGTRSLWRYAAA